MSETKHETYKSMLPLKTMYEGRNSNAFDYPRIMHDLACEFEVLLREILARAENGTIQNDTSWEEKLKKAIFLS